jgi:hypothetical protein
MSTITLRNVKGSALTFQEGDDNFTNLNNDKLENISQDTFPALGGDLNGGNFVVSNLKLQEYKEIIHSLGSTDTPTVDPANGNVQTVTISSALTLPAFTGASAGQSITLIVNGTGTASGAGYLFAGGNTTLTTLSVVSIFYDGTNYLASIATDFQ